MDHITAKVVCIYYSQMVLSKQLCLLETMWGQSKMQHGVPLVKISWYCKDVNPHKLQYSWLMDAVLFTTSGSLHEILFGIHPMDDFCALVDLEIYLVKWI